MAICKHVCGEKLRNVAGAGRELITSDFSKWDIKFWNKNLLIMDKNLEVIDEVEEKKSIINYKEVVVDNEINMVDISEDMIEVIVGIGDLIDE